MRYIVGPLIAQNANLNGNVYCAGQASPSAALGFAGALLRNCGHATWDYRVLPVFHSVSLSDGRQRAAPRSEKGELKAVELQEMLSGEVIFSLIIDAPYHLDERRVARAISKMRFSGGVLSTLDGSPLHSKFRSVDGATIKDIRPLLKRGFALIPAVDREGSDVASAGEEETLRKIDGFLRTKRGPGGGYIVAVPAGYRLLEAPSAAKPRPGSRDDSTKHVFSEPCVGLGEYLSIRSQRIVNLNESDLSPFMWRWACDDLHRFTMFSEFHLNAITNS